MDFVHLHVHSHYSLLNSTIQIPALADRVRDAGMTAVALTDSGNLFGAIQFVGACTKAKVKPILGCEVVLNDERASGRDHHLVLLCRNAEGYANLRALVTRASLDGPRDGQPAISHDLLATHASGLTALSGCLGGEVPQAILRGDLDAALQAARWYDEVFGHGHFFLELEANDLAEQEVVNEALIEMSRRTGIPVVATSNAHYLDREDAMAHAVLNAIALKATLEPEHLRSLPLRSFHLAHPEEMASRFRHCPEALQNTVRIADEVESDILKLKSPLHFPVFQTPNGKDPASFLAELAREGLARRLTAMRARGETPDESRYRERLEYEVSAIISMGFAAYYLIVWDFIQWAKSRDIPVGPGRGSGAGSLVAYAIGITDIDPLCYDLLFERFLNPERVTPPDFDVDFCERRRDEVIAYVRERYGQDHVGQIITFTTLGAKAAIKDVVRVMGLPFAEANRITKMIPHQPDMTLDKAIAQEPRLAEMVKGPQADPTLRAVFEVARTLEGLARQPGKHPAGVVISDRPVSEYAPLYRMDDGVVVTQFEMKDLDAVGLIKFDLLGLTALTIIADAVRLIRERVDPDFRLEDIPLDDQATYDLIASGETRGVFQLESRGITEVVRRLKPERFEDLIALLALYRPGPLGGGVVQEFIDRKHGLKPVTYPLPELEPILAETYGIFLYQEQVMRAASAVAGFSLGQADLLRRAMGKKQAAELEAHHEPFVRGATERGHDPRTAEAVFATMVEFAKYGFNKSHSAAYALLTYRTAYLKAHYPREYLCALLTAEKGAQNKVMGLIREARARGVAVALPDVNRSGAGFTVEDEVAPDGRVRPTIRFGLSAIKGIGDAAVEAILEARKAGPFADVVDFLMRVDGRKVNRRVIEALIHSGAMDGFGHTRRALSEGLDRLLERVASRKAEQEGGQMGLFDLGPAQDGRGVPDLPEWPPSRRLAAERAAIGYYLSGHPLDEYRAELRDHEVRSIADLVASGREDIVVSVAGVVVERSEKVSKTGGRMAFVTLDDATGLIECCVYSNVYDQWAAVADLAEPLLMRGSLRIEEDEKEERVRFVVNAVEPLETARYRLARAVEVALDLSRVTEETVLRVRDVVRARKGSCPLVFALALPGVGRVRLRASSEWSVEPGPPLLADLESVFGPGCVRLA